MKIETGPKEGDKKKRAYREGEVAAWTLMLAMNESKTHQRKKATHQAKPDQNKRKYDVDREIMKKE